MMVAIAALLWFLYFVPTWIARREYLDTERTATRLQQTLRIMAETAELPEQVRVEVTARDAARQERVLRARERAEERRADALAARAAATVRAETRSAPRMPRTAASVSWTRDGAAPSTELAERARRRRRRAHRLATLLMIVATVTIGIQLLLVATTGITAGAWLVFATGAAFGIAGVTVRRRPDARSARPAVAARGHATSSAAQQPNASRDAAERQESASGWTPVPVPAPLYLSKPEVQPVRPSPNLAAQLRAAALEADEALRAAHAEPEVVPIRPDAGLSRWAAMGRVETQGGATPDLDEVLRRRRAAG